MVLKWILKKPISTYVRWIYIHIYIYMIQIYIVLTHVSGNIQFVFITKKRTLTQTRTHDRTQTQQRNKFWICSVPSTIWSVMSCFIVSSIFGTLKCTSVLHTLKLICKHTITIRIPLFNMTHLFSFFFFLVQKPLQLYILYPTQLQEIPSPKSYNSSLIFTLKKKIILFLDKLSI